MTRDPITDHTYMHERGWMVYVCVMYVCRTTNCPCNQSARRRDGHVDLPTITANITDRRSDVLEKRHA